MLRLATTMILIDTSAMIAILCKDDHYHTPAKKVWFDLLSDEKTIHCNNYILTEAVSLIQRRHGINILRLFQSNMLPLLHVEWLTEQNHAEAMDALLTANRRRLSLVDCSAFATMRRLGMRTAFTFDTHFVKQGFEVIPGIG